MIPEIRKAYNESFTAEKYAAFLDYIKRECGHSANFRVAESPVFIPNELKHKLLEACTELNRVINSADFKQRTEEALKNAEIKVPNEDEHTRFLQMDFGICINEDGEILPQMVEVQGFPTLYFFQDLLYQSYKANFDIPSEMTSHFGGLTSEKYIELLRKVIVGDSDPKNVVLLEIEPERQTTSVDFYATASKLHIKVLCISDMKKRGKTLFYIDENGNEIIIERIYNRIIFDELMKLPDLQRDFYFKDEVNVEWIGHPNWFYRISKFTMPLFKSRYVPECHYLSELKEYPKDLENYVLKPLYSFAGTGVKLNITKADLDEIEDKDNFILQRKVTYHPVIDTPSGPAKFEIRMLMLWEKGAKDIRIVNNLVRLSKGEMVGVRYNKDKDWVGGSVAFFMPD